MPIRIMLAKVSPKPAIQLPGPPSFALRAADVAIVSVVEPVPVIEAGIKAADMLSRGRPEHDAAEKLTVPLYPG